MAEFLAQLQRFNKASAVLLVGIVVAVLNVAGLDVNEFVALLVAVGAVAAAPANKKP